MRAQLRGDIARAERPLTPAQAREIIRQGAGREAESDDADANHFPMQLEAAGDSTSMSAASAATLTNHNGLALFVGRRTAAEGRSRNAVQIAPPPPPRGTREARDAGAASE